MAPRIDILNVFNKIVKTFLWKDQWISADEWTKHIKTWHGMQTVTVEEVNRVLMKEAATVSEFISAAKPKLLNIRVESTSS
jgi:hypothetical protein